MKLVSGDPTAASASQSRALPGPSVKVMVTVAPPATDVSLTVRTGWPPGGGGGGGAAATVTVGLVAARTYPLFRNRRNSYVPGVVGIVTVHVRVVTPAPTKVHVRNELFGAPTAA